MARYEHLPIYKKAMDLTIYLEKIVWHFSRFHKYTFWSDFHFSMPCGSGPRSGARRGQRASATHAISRRGSS